MSPRPPSPVKTVKLNTSRLAAFNARRRNQVSDQNIVNSLYTQLSLRWTPCGPASTVRLRQVSSLRKFRYSKMTEKWCAGTNSTWPFYRGVRLEGSDFDSFTL